MININYRDPHPIYEQIKLELQRLILTGAMPPGSKLPSVRELATELAINPNTIQRAYRELEDAGYTVTVTGRGSFVAETAAISRQEQQSALDAFSAAAAQLRRLGYDTDALIALISKDEEGMK